MTCFSQWEVSRHSASRSLKYAMQWILSLCPLAFLHSRGLPWEELPLVADIPQPRFQNEYSASYLSPQPKSIYLKPKAESHPSKSANMCMGKKGLLLYIEWVLVCFAALQLYWGNSRLRHVRSVITYLFFFSPHKLGSQVSHIWGNRKGQHIWSAMNKSRPGKTTFMIMESPLPGKYIITYL